MRNNIKQTVRSSKLLMSLYRIGQFVITTTKLNLVTWTEKKHVDRSGLPYPSPTLRYRVHGDMGLDSFLANGCTIAQDIENALGNIGKDLNSFEQILDFGCGCGRVLRYFQGHRATCHFYGIDIDEEAIAWCKTNLGGIATFERNNQLPPTQFSEGSFDLIYAISIFTHIDEQMQFAWLAELKRILKSGGLLVASVHGDHVRNLLLPEDRAIVTERGFLYRVGATGLLKLDGLPDFYQTAYHSKEYVNREWSRILTPILYLERGVNNHQDLVVLCKG